MSTRAEPILGGAHDGLGMGPIGDVGGKRDTTGATLVARGDDRVEPVGPAGDAHDRGPLGRRRDATASPIPDDTPVTIATAPRTSTAPT